MSAGDRRKNGKPKDIVRHLRPDGSSKTLCGRENPGYATSDPEDADCMSCLRAAIAAKDKEIDRCHRFLFLKR